MFQLNVVKSPMSDATLTQGFDPQNPPDPALIDACVHCGFCLTTCPSYRVLGTEMDSPRGRIYSMDAVNQGTIDLVGTTAQHFDTCLGCLACVSACPSGVRYDRLIESTRAQVARNQPRSWSDRLIRRLIFSLFPYPQRLRALLVPLFLYQRAGIQSLVRATPLLKRLSPQLAAMDELLPNVPTSAFRPPMPTRIPAQSMGPGAAQGDRRYRVGLILGCVQRLLFSEVNDATVRVLTANGCEVHIPSEQGCCAALPQHQGETQQAETMAKRMIDSFEGLELDAIIINAAGCGHTLKEYGHLLQDDPSYRHKAAEFASKVQDVQEFLAAIRLIAPLSPLQSDPLAVVYQDACHLLHGQQISLPPRQLLRQIPGVELREPLDAALCCGSAGVYNMLQPEVAAELGQQKVDNLLNTGATIIASPNPGCALQIRQHLRQRQSPVPVVHPMTLLDCAIQGKPLAEYLSQPLSR